MNNNQKIKDFNKEITIDNFNKRNINHVNSTKLINYCYLSVKYIKYPPIIFIYKTTLDAVDHAYQTYPNCRIAILNFANGKYPGGGYLTGAIAQEEDLCRRIPELYTSLLYSSKKKHSCYSFGACTKSRYSSILLTPNMLIKRDKDLTFINNPEKWKSVSVISAAAPNIRSNQYYNHIKMKETVDNIFNTACYYNNDKILILGAWGCGAFGNDPTGIANLFKNAILKGMASNYIAIYFAIPGIHNDRNSYNSYMFYNVLNKAGLIKSTII